MNRGTLKPEVQKERGIGNEKRDIRAIIKRKSIALKIGTLERNNKHKVKLQYHRYNKRWQINFVQKGGDYILC